MATLREIRRRILSVKSTQKITKAMKMVAAAKFRRAQDTLIAIRPYARKLDEILKRFVAKIDISTHPLLIKRDVKRILLVVISGDRGLCGGFNSNVAKAAVEHIKKNYSSLNAENYWVRVVTIGKKCTDFFQKKNFPIHTKHVGIFGNLNFNQAKSIVQQIVAGFINNDYDKVEIIYNEFKSVIQQRIVVEQILPILPEQILKSESRTDLSQIDYIYEPSSQYILDDLLPKHLNFQMWRILLESSTAEEGARMTAMNNATENAKDLISNLTLSYNKARQASITKELLEVVSGAEALKKAS